MRVAKHRMYFKGIEASARERLRGQRVKDFQDFVVLAGTNKSGLSALACIWLAHASATGRVDKRVDSKRGYAASSTTASIILKRPPGTTLRRHSLRQNIDDAVQFFHMDQTAGAQGRKIPDVEKPYYMPQPHWRRGAKCLHTC